MPDAKITTPNARSKLAVRGKPYYRLIHQGLHLGYRKLAKGGRWVMRVYVDRGNYRTETIATADDEAPANDLDVLNFQQAKDRASLRATEILAASSGRSYGPFTVKDALDHYLTEKLAHEGRDTADNKRRLGRIAEDLGHIEVSKLTKQDVSGWLRTMAETPPMLRGGKVRQVDMNDPDVKRRRRDSANRFLNDLKAALNFAVEEEKATAGSWRDAKPFKLAGDNRPRYLTLEEVTRLLNAAEPDLRAPILGGLMTGARRGDLVGMVVGDFMPEAGAVMIGNRKVRYKGKPPFPCYLSPEGVAFFSGHTADRQPGEPMFLRSDGQAWREDDIARPLKAANAKAGIKPAASVNVLRHTYASHAVMAGMTLAAVAANLGHSDTRMVETHYAHLAPDWRKEQAQRMPNFGIEADSKAVNMASRQA